MKNFKNSKLSQYVHEIVGNLTGNRKIHFANVENNQSTSLKYLSFVIFSTKLAFGEFQKLKSNHICTLICGISI